MKLGTWKKKRYSSVSIYKIYNFVNAFFLILQYHNIENSCKKVTLSRKQFKTILWSFTMLKRLFARFDSNFIIHRILEITGLHIPDFFIFHIRLDKSSTKLDWREKRGWRDYGVREPLSQKMTRRPRRSFSQSFLLFVPRSAGRRHTRETPGGRHPYRFTVSRAAL